MVETSLINVREALNNGITLSKGMDVVIPKIGDASIYGFLSTLNDAFSHVFDMPPLGRTTVLSNRILCYIGQQLCRFIIFDKVTKVTGDRLDIQYLYIPKFAYIDNPRGLTAYKKVMGNVEWDSYIAKLNRVEVEDDKAYYLPEDNEIYFESSSKLKGVSKGCAVVTKRLSNNAEAIVYEVHNYNDVFVERYEPKTM